VTERPADFVLPVDKPEGPTSHDVVAAARKALSERRIGHTGTLDPFASGLLLLCVGRATRLAEYFSGLDKEYEAEARLGIATDTLDRDGNVVAVSERWSEVTEEGLEAALGALRGDIEQVPPQFSAKKVEGERAYKSARDGRRVELPPVPVTVRELTLTGVDLPFVRFRVRCSSGTYVRALARDLGAGLGVGAHLTALRRTAVGPRSVEGALRLDDLGDSALVAGAAVRPLERRWSFRPLLRPRAWSPSRTRAPWSPSVRRTRA
jgi:tRNA pseudouridine55 synthase